MILDYGNVTLEDLYMYHYYDFECDGDKKQIIIRRKENE